MAKMDIPLDRLAEACAKARESAEYEGELQTSMRRIGLHAVSISKKETPVESGYLRANWVMRIDGNWILIENNVKYAAAVNYGHRQKVGRYVPKLGKTLKQPYVAGKYMLEKAMEQTVKYTMPKELQRMIERVLRCF